MGGVEERKIYGISVTKFGNKDTRKILTILDETYNGEISFRMQWKKWLNSRLYDRYDYQYSGNTENKLIAFYSDFYFRKDHFTIFSDFIKKFPFFDYVIPIRLPMEHRNWKRGLEMLKWDIQNLWLLRNRKVRFKKKIYWVYILGLVQLYCKRMKRYLERKKYSYGMVYSDSNPYENMLVQYMKEKGIYTATLQHGIFDKNGYWKGLEFRTSVADDWLAWNFYTKDLAIECGIPRDKIKVLGIPRYINPVKLEKNANVGVFSVILGGKVLKEENQKLVEFANLLARKKNLKYFLRYHPTCKGNEYASFVDQQLIVTMEEQNGTIKQMCEHSDFSLIGSGTSMIIDLIYLGQPFFQYEEKWDGVRYKGRENCFRNFEELKKQVEKQTMTLKDEMFCYYCTTKEVKESYNKYFNSICERLM